MDRLQERLEALEQRTHTVARQLRWWRGVACSLIVLALLTWALPLSTAQEDAWGGGQGLAQRVAALEHKLRHITSGTDEEGRAEVVITGANLRIVNGLGQTGCLDEHFEPIPNCPNGLGNLFVGYNEPRDPSGGGDVRTGSHHVIIGQQHNFSRVGGLAVGRSNEISGDFAAVCGGSANIASGQESSVCGGSSNTASGTSAAVSGGQVNVASGDFSAISGGVFNTATRH